jgi:hypothetical protein
MRVGGQRHVPAALPPGKTQWVGFRSGLDIWILKYGYIIQSNTNIFVLFIICFCNIYIYIYIYIRLHASTPVMSHLQACAWSWYIQLYAKSTRSRITKYFADHTQRRNTVGKTPLDEWSARRRDLYQTTHATEGNQCLERDLNLQFQQVSGRRPAPLPRGHWDRHYLTLL